MYRQPLTQRVSAWRRRLTEPRLWRWSWALIFLVALFARPPYPLDETRYLAVAWEMWRDGSLLVPHLNGYPYPDKPPLLFWLWQGGWMLFGVGEVWPRFVAAACMGGTAFTLHATAAQLWPHDGKVQQYVPLVFAGTLYVALYTQMLMFDGLLVLLIAMSWRALLLAHRPAVYAGLLTGAAILTKGPVALVYIVPFVLLMPQFGQRRGSLLLVTILTSLVLPAVWLGALLAAGHSAFVEMLLVGQLLGRMEGEIGHGRPVWWYLPLLPLLFLPWSAVPAVWLALRRRWTDETVRRFLLAGLTMLLVLSVIGGKQSHYLLPLLALAALPIGYALAQGSTPRFATAQIVVILSVVVLLVPLAVSESGIKAVGGLRPMDAWPALLPLLLFLAGFLLDSTARQRTVESLTLASIITAIALLLLVSSVMNRSHDVRDVAKLLSVAEGAGIELAYVGDYHGDFNFSGRLSRPVREIDAATAATCAQPRMTLAREEYAGDVAGKRVHVQDYRGGRLSVLLCGVELPKLL